MVDVDYKNFYLNYAYDYHVYKICTLEAILKDVSGFNEHYLSSRLVGFKQTDFIRFVKTEIRMTCFHAIETLFELIFALEPRNGSCRDFSLLQGLSTSNFTKNYIRIGHIASDDKSLSFLDTQTPGLGNHPLWMHIFYFAPPLSDPAVIEVLEESKTAILLFLQEIAKVFADRNEYNAYKHGIRALNLFHEFGISDPDGTKPMTVNLTDSMSFFTVEKDNKGKILAEVINTKMFNTAKDIKMVHLCSQLITNIIRRRKWVFMPEDRKEQLETFNFTKSEVIDMIRTSHTSTGLNVDKMAFRKDFK